MGRHPEHEICSLLQVLATSYEFQKTNLTIDLRQIEMEFEQDFIKMFKFCTQKGHLKCLQLQDIQSAA